MVAVKPVTDSKPIVNAPEKTVKGAPFYSGPLSGALRQLVNAACGDLKTARLTLGLINSIIGSDEEVLFPGYAWSVTDVVRFPAELLNDARKIVEGAFNTPGLILNEFYLGRRRIVQAVHRMRARSPLGRRFCRQVLVLKKEYPPLRATEWRTAPAGETLETIDLLPDEIGRPLSERTIALVRAIHSGKLQIISDSEPMNGVWTPKVASIRLNPDGYTIQSITLCAAVWSPQKKKGARRFQGELIDFFETGCAGVIWMIYDDRYRGRDGLQMIEEGDKLTILDQLGKVVWHGVIQCDRKTGWQRYPLNPQYGQQCASGHWVQWIQKGFKIDDWAAFFIRPSYDRLYGVLVRKKNAAKRIKASKGPAAPGRKRAR
jgi:hypothetical protein